MTLAHPSGFGNPFATEAVPGALPVGRNRPQKAPHGLVGVAAHLELADRSSPC